MKRWLLAVSLSLVASGAASAQTLEDYDYENLEFRGIGFDFGAVKPVRVAPTLVMGLRADMGLVGPNLRIAPAIRFWSSDLRDTELQRLSEQFILVCQRQAATTCPSSLDLGEIKMSDLELSTDAHYLFETGYTLQPYLGGGLGLHLLNGRGEFIDDTFVEDLLDTVTPSLNFVGGAGVPIGGSLQLIAEARYVLLSDLRYGMVALGGTWSLPSPPRNPFSPPSAGESR